MHPEGSSRREPSPAPSWQRTTPLIDIAAVFGIGALVVGPGLPLAGENPLARQGVVWVAYIFMLATVGLILRLRGQKWRDLGLVRLSFDRRTVWRLVWRSIVLLIAVLVAWVAGAIVMANITGIPEQADFSGYNYLSGNLPMLVLALVGVWIVSSFGEEVLFRGFLITRLADIGNRSTLAWRLAVVTSSIAFGLIHYEWGAMGMVQTGLIGLALGSAFLLLGRTLWVPILTHFYIDTVLLMQLYFAP